MKPMIHEIMAAGPAIEDASHAPNNQPEPINEPSPTHHCLVYTSPTTQK